MKVGVVGYQVPSDVLEDRDSAQNLLGEGGGKGIKAGQKRVGGGVKKKEGLKKLTYLKPATAIGWPWGKL